jgi:hypothetical protein
MLEIKFIIRAAFLRDCISDGVCVGGRRRLCGRLYVDVRKCRRGRHSWDCVCRQAPDYQQVATPYFIGFLNPSMRFVELSLSRLRRLNGYLMYRLLA